jgi:hypothetical protein
VQQQFNGHFDSHNVRIFRNTDNHIDTTKAIIVDPRDPITQLWHIDLNATPISKPFKIKTMLTLFDNIMQFLAPQLEILSTT